MTQAEFANATLRGVLLDNGYMNKAQLNVLAVSYPGLKVGIKFGCSMRVGTTAAQAESVIADRIRANPQEEYVREVFIPCNEFDTLNAAFTALDARKAQPLNPTTPNWENSVESFLTRD